MLIIVLSNNIKRVARNMGSVTSVRHKTTDDSDQEMVTFKSTPNNEQKKKIYSKDSLVKKVSWVIPKKDRYKHVRTSWMEKRKK